jgi:hypothetical protein
VSESTVYDWTSFTPYRRFPSLDLPHQTENAPEEAVTRTYIIYRLFRASIYQIGHKVTRSEIPGVTLVANTSKNGMAGLTRITNILFPETGHARSKLCAVSATGLMACSPSTVSKMLVSAE